MTHTDTVEVHIGSMESDDEETITLKDRKNGAFSSYGVGEFKTLSYPSARQLPDSCTSGGSNLVQSVTFSGTSSIDITTGDESKSVTYDVSVLQARDPSQAGSCSTDSDCDGSNQCNNGICEGGETQVNVGGAVVASNCRAVLVLSENSSVSTGFSINIIYFPPSSSGSTTPVESGALSVSIYEPQSQTYGYPQVVKFLLSPDATVLSVGDMDPNGQSSGTSIAFNSFTYDLLEGQYLTTGQTGTCTFPCSFAASMSDERTIEFSEGGSPHYTEDIR
ncbi:hypothetical protein FIV42_14430 [Persicimonas caeni]|uniref:Uncharacterized protein n=1 Tax=Persicimonas caeni TaxID=2292766 RepID=A0A4Y6PUH2_PERCE|nr:hypothetical protein [Persicimonas caeni]QDG51893.1 hypothetical protein FIV42_14430 [Persicimonas caeni]QED33114.1 hypothetical protein FRD00_14425 [Persicimonas caeni]